MAPKAARSKAKAGPRAEARAKARDQGGSIAAGGKVHQPVKLRVKSKTSDPTSHVEAGMRRRPAAVEIAPLSSNSTKPTPFVVTLLFYNDLQKGSLQYKALGTFATVADANRRVCQELAKWREEDARPACEERVRHLEGEERTMEMKRLVHSSVVINSKKDRGMLVVSASLKGLDLMGSSNHWRWRPLPDGSDLAAAAADFWRELPGRPLGADAPVPHPFV